MTTRAARDGANAKAARGLALEAEGQGGAVGNSRLPHLHRFSGDLLTNSFERIILVNTRHIPERSCVACGQKHPKRDLVRVLRTPAGSVVVDLAGKGSGRGAYLCWSSDCWLKGVKKGALERSLKLSFSLEDHQHLWAFYQEAVSTRPASEGK